MSKIIDKINENPIKNEIGVLNLNKRYNNITHRNTLLHSISTNISTNNLNLVDINNFQRNNSLINNKRKIVTFNPNFKLVETIFFDPKEPAIKNNNLKKENKIEKIINKKEINELKIKQIKKNEEDNALCTCLIF